VIDEAKERTLIGRILDSLAEDEPRARYAEWLRERGDAPRSNVVRAMCDRGGQIDVDALGAALSELDDEHHGWSRLVGARLVHEACSVGLQRFVTRWLKLGRPALELVVGDPIAEAPLGASRLWGDPDLPPGTPWPTLSDCRRWEPQIALPADSPCQFVAQINLADLAARPAARALPKRGLISVFAHHEWATTGSASICLRYFPSTEELERVPHAATNHDNRGHGGYGIRLKEALTIPEGHGSPFAKSVGIDDGDWETMEKHRQVLLASGGGLLGVLGHARATTGLDPTPGEDWERLITVPIDPDAVVIHHLAIKRSRLAAGRLEDHELVWVDFDGS
jgi:uncharacterized protein (TIGR02996 family)